MSLYLGENLISGQATLVGESRNIGQIIPSTIPLTDAGLHLLDGALIQGNGIYSAFVTYIAGLVSTYPDLFITEASWQTSVTNYGVCGKFVYDSTNNTVRLPKITGIIEGTIDVSALGDLVEAGLPNITGSNFGREAGVTLGGACVTGDSTTYAGYSSYNGNHTNFDASASNPIYGNSSTVQPQTIKAFYYIVIATSTKTDIQVDIDEIATDLNGKADVDLTNLSDTGKIAIVHNAMPSATYEDLTLGASETIYTAPEDGWVFLYGSLQSGYDRGFGILANRTTGYRVMSTIVWTNYGNIICWLPVNKGDAFKVYYQNYVNNTFRFYYANGNKSEAQ